MVGASSKQSPELLPDGVYSQLRGLAAAMLNQESPGHSLPPTALVHEAYLRLARQNENKGASREQLLALGAMMIRRVLIDHYRRKTALKRGGECLRTADPNQAVSHDASTVLAIDEALVKLESLDPVKSRIVLLKFYGGMSVDQIAALIGESPRTVARQWAFARAWLGQELSP